MSRDAAVIALNPTQWRRTTDEREFLPAALEIMETPASPVGRAIGGVIVAAVVASLAWACIGQVDIIATATGRLVPVGRTKIIQPFETGVVSAILVSDGDHVKAGQTLISIDPTQAQADRDHYRRDWLQARLELARLRGIEQALAHGTPATLMDTPTDASAEDITLASVKMRAQMAGQDAKLRALDEQIIEKQGEADEAAAGLAKLQASLPWQTAETQIRRNAKDLKYGNQVAWVEAERSLVEEQQELGVLARHREQALAGRAALVRQREQAVAEFQDGVLGDLAKARTQASELEANLSKAEQRLALDTLRAPIDGTVESLSVHTVGGVVTPAQALMLVVPDEARLVVEAGVENKDVGFVHPGQRAEVKVETFAFTRYGMIDGTVQALSRDAVLEGGDRKASGQKRDEALDDEAPVARPASYMARIALDRNWIDTEAGRMTLGAGMSVSAEIYTGRRRIIEFLLSPLQRLAAESAHER
jgi:hemolysin D